MKYLAALVLMIGLPLLGGGLQAAPVDKGQTPMVIESITGEVTQKEIEAFKTFMQTQTPPSNPWGAVNGNNAMSTGIAGRQVEAMGLMYEITADPEILNRMILFVDAFVAARNDFVPLSQGGQRVLWTGKVEKAWMAFPPTSSASGYAASEHAEIISHIVYSAKLILQTPSIWNKTVPDGNPHGYGATYKERAIKYIEIADESNDEYLLKYYVNPNTNLIRNPANWPVSYFTVQSNMSTMLITGALQRLAECHVMLGKDLRRVTQYDAIVKASVREVIEGMKNQYDVGGKPVYVWYISAANASLNMKTVETVSRAAYEMLGLYRAFQRGVYGIQPREMIPFANTLAYVIAKAYGRFAGTVDGRGGLKEGVATEWIVLADWNPAVYELVAKPMSAATLDAYNVALILWMKHRLATSQ